MEDCVISVGFVVVGVKVNRVVVVVVVMVVVVVIGVVVGVVVGMVVGVVVPTASHDSIHRSKVIKHSSSQSGSEQLCKQSIQLLWQFS